MVFFDLIIHAVSENIAEINFDNPDLEWHFRIECSHCKSEQPNEIYFKRSDENELTKGHGTANFVMNCKECGKHMNISLHSKSPLKLECESGNDEGRVAIFECRGCEILSWKPREGVRVEAKESGTVFYDVDITEMWMDYDEQANQNVSLIEPVEIEIKKNKNI